MISYEIGYRNNMQTHEITWAVAPLSHSQYTAAHDLVYRQAYYGPIRPETMRSLQGVAPDATKDQLEGIYNATLREKTMHAHSRIPGLLREIAAQYATTSICDLAAKYNIPPLNTLRAYWRHHGLGKETIKQFLKTGHGGAQFNARDVEQHGNAITCDNEHYSHVAQISAAADSAEARLVALIKAQGIPCRTQAELSEEQTLESGRAIITPDILFTAPTYMNGSPVYWIDYKNYIGIPVPFQVAKTAVQVDKYTKKWGPGAIIYGASFVEGLELGCKIFSFVEYNVTEIKKKSK